MNLVKSDKFLYFILLGLINCIEKIQLNRSQREFTGRIKVPQVGLGYSMLNRIKRNVEFNAVSNTTIAYPYSLKVSSESTCSIGVKAKANLKLIGIFDADLHGRRRGVPRGACPLGF